MPMRRPCAAGINTAGRLSYTMFTSAVCTLELDVYGGKNGKCVVIGIAIYICFDDDDLRQTRPYRKIRRHIEGVAPITNPANLIQTEFCHYGENSADFVALVNTFSHNCRVDSRKKNVTLFTNMLLANFM